MSLKNVASNAVQKLCWLDLRGTGLSVVERLCLEEALLRHDDRNWAILGTHEPVEHKYLRLQNEKISKKYNNNDKNYNDIDEIIDNDDVNTSCIIVMGIGGKPHELLNVDLVKRHGVPVIKRFSGGGTVVLDPSSIWTTFIARTINFPHVDPYPREIMEWSADAVFTKTFQKMKQISVENNKNDNGHGTTNGQRTLVPSIKSCSATENTGKLITIPASNNNNYSLFSMNIPEFALRENDYVLGERKIGGNAQSIVKGGWLHHTSFLWDFNPDNMQYLSLPSKRPEYRGDRSHDDFLVKLSNYYGKSNRLFFSSVKETCTENFDLEEKNLSDAMSIINQQFGGMQTWFDAKSRTRYITDF